MTKANYAYNDLNEHTASAYGRSLHISTKVSINICNALRYKSVDKAIAYLDDVIAMKRAVPFTRFTDGVGHRRGPMAAGRYPIKAAEIIRDLIKSAASNAENKGFSEELKIVHLCAHKASTPMRQGRQRRRSAKRTHVEVVVKEQANAKAKTKAKPVQKEAKEAPVAEKKAAPVAKETTKQNDSSSEVASK
ncbi:MAG: 50S ribosomal protein L22 [Nanoarchaeota archaeon]|nr:50S ribosomal protein L22 [Nanoarchaeota archaeon]